MLNDLIFGLGPLLKAAFFVAMFLSKVVWGAVIFDFA
jgi:hypothetical protein